jgi:hypothetical protein
MDPTLAIPNLIFTPSIPFPLLSAVKGRLTKIVATSVRSWHRSYVSLVTYACIVASVSAYDIWLTIEYAQFLPQLEQNPIGRWIMNLDYYRNQSHFGGVPDVTLFVWLKGLGTCFVVGVIGGLQIRMRRIGHPVAVGVSLFQLGLAYYLTYVGK